MISYPNLCKEQESALVRMLTLGLKLISAGNGRVRNASMAVQEAAGAALA